jgi:hypothetical protein
MRAGSIVSQSERNTRKFSTANPANTGLSKASIIFKNRDAFSLFVKIIGELQIRARSVIVIQPFLDLFVMDQNFEKICGQFTKSIFEEVMTLVGGTKKSLEDSGLLEEEAINFKSGFEISRIIPFSLHDQKLILSAKHVETYKVDPRLLQESNSLLQAGDHRAENQRSRQQEQRIEAVS